MRSAGCLLVAMTVALPSKQALGAGVDFGAQFGRIDAAYEFAKEEGPAIEGDTSYSLRGNIGGATLSLSSPSERGNFLVQNVYVALRVGLLETPRETIQDPADGAVILERVRVMDADFDICIWENLPLHLCITTLGASRVDLDFSDHDRRSIAIYTHTSSFEKVQASVISARVWGLRLQGKYTQLRDDESGGLTSRQVVGILTWGFDL